MPVGKSKWKSSKEWEEDETYQTNLASFKTWWEPFSTDSRTGASIGGQPDAWRWWARPPTEGGTRWERREYGTSAERAFKSKIYYGCWLKWKQSGEQHGQWAQYLDQDERGNPSFAVYEDAFVSNCLPIEEQAARMGEIYKAIGQKQHIA